MLRTLENTEKGLPELGGEESGLRGMNVGGSTGPDRRRSRVQALEALLAGASQGRRPRKSKTKAPS